MLNQNKVWDQLRPVDSYADAILIDQLTSNLSLSVDRRVIVR